MGLNFVSENIGRNNVSYPYFTFLFLGLFILGVIFFFLRRLRKKQALNRNTILNSLWLK